MPVSNLFLDMIASITAEAILPSNFLVRIELNVFDEFSWFELCVPDSEPRCGRLTR